jgi:hypothetical protein
MGEDSKKEEKRELLVCFLCTVLYFRLSQGIQCRCVLLNPGEVGLVGLGQFLFRCASASSTMIATVTATTPNNASAATIAIIAIDDVVVVSSLPEYFMLEISKELILLRVPAMKAL